jgi:hypothetical protein
MAHLGDQSINEQQMLQALAESVYGSADQPRFEFTHEFARLHMYDELLRELIFNLLEDIESGFGVKQRTDFNTDHCLAFEVDGPGNWRLEFSLVGRFAACFRMLPTRLVPIEQTHHESIGSLKLMPLLAKHHVRLMGKDELELPLKMRLFDTDPENVVVYQVFFRDVDILPWKI